MSASELERARSYFQELVKYRWLRVKRPTRGMLGGGAAHYFGGTIYVPTIKNKSDFYLCLHEVGHMTQPPTCLENPEDAFSAEAAVIDEYIAEMFALQHSHLFGLDTALFEKHAKRYVFTYVNKVHQRGIKWADVDERVRNISTNWLGITEADWSAQGWRLVD